MVAELKQLRAAAQMARKRARAETLKAVRLLHKSGFSYRDIGYLLGISDERARQINLGIC